MKRNATLLAAAALLVSAGLVQAEGTNATIVESAEMLGAGGGAYEYPHWKEESPFPTQYGRVVD